MRQQLYWVYTTLPDKDSAKKITKFIIENKYAVCANQFSEVTATYLWQGQLTEGTEVAIIFKTLSPDKLSQIIKDQHPYDTPCIITLNLEATNIEYLNWAIKNQTLQSAT